jgi:hypothetical protein
VGAISRTRGDVLPRLACRTRSTVGNVTYTRSIALGTNVLPRGARLTRPALGLPYIDRTVSNHVGTIRVVVGLAGTRFTYSTLVFFCTILAQSHEKGARCTGRAVGTIAVILTARAGTLVPVRAT